MFVLITGGAGFIGRNLVDYLLQKGCRVRVLDNFSAGTAHYLSGLDVDVVAGDIRRAPDVSLAVAGVEAIIHLAAQVSVSAAVANPFSDCRTNILGTLNLLEAARSEEISHFVFASSNAVLGDQPPPATEESVPRPISPYGASKLAGEGYCQAYQGSYGLRTTIFRFANVYGPFCGHNSSVISQFCHAALDGRPLTIYGDGAQTRDFVYVADLCAALWAGLAQEAAGEIFQVATGIETSINELAAAMVAVTGMETAVAHTEKRAGDIYKNYAAIGKIERDLGWRPEVSLSQGLQRTWDWFQKGFGQ